MASQPRVSGRQQAGVSQAHRGGRRNRGRDPREAGNLPAEAPVDNDPNSIRNQMKQAALGWRDAGMPMKDFPAVTFVIKPSEEDEFAGPAKPGIRGVFQKTNRAVGKFNKAAQKFFKLPTTALATVVLAIGLNVAGPSESAEARDLPSEGNRTTEVSGAVRSGLGKTFNEIIKAGLGDVSSTIVETSIGVINAFSGKKEAPKAEPKEAAITRRDDAAIAQREAVLNALVDGQGVNTPVPPAPRPAPAKPVVGGP